MGNDRFSRRGMPPTAFEIELMRAAAGDSVWLDIARRLMAEHGAEQGARALLVVLDTLGTEKVHVPCRESLFRSLYRPHRNRQVLEALDSGSKSTAEIAADAEVSESTVRSIAQSRGRRTRKFRVRRRA